MAQAPSHRDIQAQLEEILRGLPDDIYIVEAGIDPKVMTSYQALAEQLPDSNPQHDLAELLVFAKENPERLQAHLAVLGESGEVESYRLLEQLQVELGEDESWSSWLKIAKTHCQLRIENNLLDEPIGFIATGLGGKGRKIRYCFALAASEAQNFNEAKANFVRQELEALAQESEAEIEEMNFEAEYLVFTLVLPYKQSLLDLIQGLQQACGNLLAPEFFVTNIRKPSPEEMQAWLDGHLEDEGEFELDGEAQAFLDALEDEDYEEDEDYDEDEDEDYDEEDF